MAALKGRTKFHNTITKGGLTEASSTGSDGEGTTRPTVPLPLIG